MIELSSIPTADLREELLRRNAGKKGNPSAAVAMPLVTLVGQCYGLSKSQVLSKRRDMTRCHARWAVFAALAHIGWTCDSICACFDFDRGTVIHGLRRAGELVETDEQFRGVLRLLKHLLQVSSPVSQVQ